MQIRRLLGVSLLTILTTCATIKKPQLISNHHDISGLIQSIEYSSNSILSIGTQRNFLMTITKNDGANITVYGYGSNQYDYLRTMMKAHQPIKIACAKGYFDDMCRIQAYE